MVLGRCGGRSVRQWTSVDLRSGTTVDADGQVTVVDTEAQATVMDTFSFSLVQDPSSRVPPPSRVVLPSLVERFGHSVGNTLKRYYLLDDSESRQLILTNVDGSCHENECMPSSRQVWPSFTCKGLGRVDMGLVS